LFLDGVLREVYATFEDISAQVQLNQELRRQATTDDLTGAHNRRHFMERLGAEFSRLQRHTQRRACVLTLDLDFFKAINDEHGHAAGDAMLRHVTLSIRELIRRDDVLGRVGGEEFAILLPETDTDEALALAERLRETIAQSRLNHEGKRLQVTVSIGVSPLLAKDGCAEQALVRADQMLYEVKRKGRDGVRLAMA
jgi:diguanylate cyclase (GGDEF)-like protein